MIFTEYLHEKAKNLTGVHLTFLLCDYLYDPEFVAQPHANPAD